jgi:lactoylglutathione lyase
MVIPIRGLFETHLTVRRLETSLAFYRDVLGLEVAHVAAERRGAFVWLGGRGHAMLGLWEVGTSPNAMRLHFAFDSSIDDVLAAPAKLRAAGVPPLSFAKEPADEPDVLCWMPALTLYFHDPDGHLLEYLAMLPEEPRPELGVVSYGEWKARRGR